MDASTCNLSWALRPLATLVGVYKVVYMDGVVNTQRREVIRHSTKTSESQVPDVTLVNQDGQVEKETTPDLFCLFVSCLNDGMGLLVGHSSTATEDCATGILKCGQLPQDRGPLHHVTTNSGRCHNVASIGRGTLLSHQFREVSHNQNRSPNMVG